jgi:hypothetical protein
MCWRLGRDDTTDAGACSPVPRTGVLEWYSLIGSPLPTATGFPPGRTASFRLILAVPRLLR